MDRLRQIYSILTGSHASLLPDNHLLVRDNRTHNTTHIALQPAGHSYAMPAAKLTQIKDEQGNPLRIYDPGYRYTLQAISSICYIDGLRGKLQYRGYPVQQLAIKSSFLQTSFLLIFGDLPDKEQLTSFIHSVSSHRILHSDLQKVIKPFRKDASPMGVLISALYALSTLTPQANPALQGQHIYKDPLVRNKHIFNIMGVLPTLVARIYRHQQGKSSIQPHPSMSYAQNFLYMIGSKLHSKTKIIKALQTLWIIHAQDESSCSTAMVRHIASSGTDLYTAIASGTGALSGAKHGGAAAAVIKMLQSIGSRQNIPRFLVEVRQKRRLLFGFGHNIFKDNDPRTQIVKQIVHQLFRTFGKPPLVHLAIQLQRIAQADQYFVTRRINPNVDFYTALVYHSMGFSSQIFPLLYCIPRAAGWLAHWAQFQEDKQAALVRPLQNYTGHGRRDFIQQSERKEDEAEIEATQSRLRVRRDAARQFKALSQ